MTLVHLNLPDEIVERIENIMEGKARSTKIINYICSNLIGRDVLLQEKERCEAKLKYINRALDDNPLYNPDSLSKEEKQFFDEMIDTIGRKPEFKDNKSFFISRNHMYGDRFGKGMPTKEFELMFYKYKEILNK